MGAYDDARNTSALVQRWQRIQLAKNKFHNFYEQLERQTKSGTTPDDMTFLVIFYKETIAVTNSYVDRDTNSNSNRTNKSRKNRWRERKMRLLVQRMYDTCKDVFAFSETGIVPSPEKIERLRAFLEAAGENDWLDKEK
ncbi:hypothetical protein ACOSQ2_032818 [Xanthoceras sorbifolium]